MTTREYVTLKDGTEVPTEDFWLYAPTWFIENAESNGVVEAIPSAEPAPTSAEKAHA